MNLAPAMSKTKPKARLMPVLENLEIPKRVPMNAPNKTASKKRGSSLGSDLVDWKLPSRPAMELTKIKAATVPLASLILTQPSQIMSGDKKIPPPVPVIPERSQLQPQYS